VAKNGAKFRGLKLGVDKSLYGKMRIVRPWKNWRLKKKYNDDADF
jgi:hypothetical protein